MPGKNGAYVMMPHSDYMAEHKRLARVLKGAKTAAASAEMRRQGRENPMMMVKAPAMVRRVRMRREDY